MFEVMNCGAFAQEFWIRSNLDVAAIDCIFNNWAEPTGTVDLVTTTAPGFRKFHCLHWQRLRNLSQLSHLRLAELARR
jgi:hypothetical protein